MTITGALKAHLMANAGVAALVGTRVYAGNAPAATLYPMIQFIQVSGQRFPILRGPRLRMPVMQIDSYAAQSTAANSGIAPSLHAEQAEAVADAAEAALVTFTGVVAGIEIVEWHLMGDQGPMYEEDGALARWRRDYEMWWGAA